ncbi:MAG: hypothetical protein WC536_04360 [Patescibacteria group bacterium]
MECCAVSNESISGIRQQVREEIEALVPASVVDDVVLVTGEVTTNVVKHCGEPNLRIWFTREDNCLIEHIQTESQCAQKARDLIELAMEHDSKEKALESIAIGREGGMGLSIVGAITKRHKITPEGEMILAFAL